MIIRRTLRLSRLGESAVSYARSGQRVIPCVPLEKRPLLADWPRTASDNEIEVTRWWTRYPDANIGILTGAPGYDVLDVDRREGGSGSPLLRELESAGLLDGAMRVVGTPSGGQHWYFPGTPQRKSKLSGRHIDFQAVGGYVLAPPSRIAVEGEVRRYRVLEERDGGQPLDWRTVRRLAAGGPSRRHVFSSARPRGGPLGYLRGARPGERNDRLFRSACWAIRRGTDPLTLIPTALSLGLTPEEIGHTITSARKAVERGHHR